MHSGRLWPLPLKPVADGPSAANRGDAQACSRAAILAVRTAIGGYLRHEFQVHSGDRILLRLVHRDVAYFPDLRVSVRALSLRWRALKSLSLRFSTGTQVPFYGRS